VDPGIRSEAPHSTGAGPAAPFGDSHGPEYEPILIQPFRRRSGPQQLDDAEARALDAHPLGKISATLLWDGVHCCSVRPVLCSGLQQLHLVEPMLLLTVISQLKRYGATVHVLGRVGLGGQP